MDSLTLLPQLSWAGVIIKREPGVPVLAVLGLLFWQQRWERALWLLISDPALLPPAAGPASSAPSPLLASLTLPTRPLQPPLDLKHLLTFHLNGTTPLSLFPNFSTVWAGQEGEGHMQVLGVCKEGDSAGPRCYQTGTQNPAVSYLEMKMMPSLPQHHKCPEMVF